MEKDKWLKLIQSRNLDLIYEVVKKNPYLS